MKERGTLAAHLALLAVSLIYGLNYSLAKEVMPEYLGPSGFILVRVTVAGLLFWIFHRLGSGQRIERGDYPRLLLCGFLGVAANQLLFFNGLNLSTPINASIMMTSSPILVIVFSTFLLGERMKILRLIGIFLGIGGALYLITSGEEFNLLSERSELGDLLVFLNAAAYAAYLVIVKPLMSRYRPLTVIKWVFLFGWIFVLPFGTAQVFAADWGAMPAGVYGEIAFVVIGTTFLAYLFNVYAMKTLSSTTVGFYIYLQPVFATMVAIYLGQDRLTWVKAVSAAMIFAGVFLVSKKRK